MTNKSKTNKQTALYHLDKYISLVHIIQKKKP